VSKKFRQLSQLVPLLPSLSHWTSCTPESSLPHALHKSLSTATKIKGRLVHVEYPMLVAMRAVKEQTSELHKLPCLPINLVNRMHQLIGFHAIEVVMLMHEVFDCFLKSFNALGTKGIWEQRWHLQADETVPDGDPLLMLRKDPHEQLMLNRMKLLIGSSKSGLLL
jgi:hypothetical protein